jgi:micrococcal nuclease
MFEKLRKYPCEVMRIVDGDTIDLRVDVGFRFSFRDNFRLARINCPEMRTQAGKSAKAWVLSYVMNCKMAGAHFLVISEKHGKYRWLADVVVVMADGDEYILNDEIVKAGHGEYYK